MCWPVTHRYSRDVELKTTAGLTRLDVLRIQGTAKSVCLFFLNVCHFKDINIWCQTERAVCGIEKVACEFQLWRTTGKCILYFIKAKRGKN